MDPRTMSGRRVPQGARGEDTLDQIRYRAKLIDLKLVLLRSSLRNCWGDWFVATPERVGWLDVELEELAKLVEEIGRCSGIPAEDLER